MIFLLIQLKHFICDFPLQAHPWMYKNKGIYGHIGGVVHSLIHMVGMFLITNDIHLSLLDFVVHYHIDYIKVKVCNKFKLNPTNSEWYWVLMGLDQLLHQVFYCYVMYRLN